MGRNKRAKLPKIKMIKHSSGPITALDIFPAEIWSQILVTKLQWKEYYNPINSQHDDFALIGSEQKWHSETLALRQVCPVFRQVLDSYLQANPYNYVLTHDHYNMNLEKESKYWKLTNHYGFKFDNPERLEDFVKHFQITHYGTDNKAINPFIGRRISLKESKYHYKTKLKAQEAKLLCERMWNGFTNVLAFYGHHVWFCSVQIQDKFPNRVDYLNKIRQWLEMMPNLRGFTIKYARDLGNPTSRELQELETELTANSFPKLEHLKFLKMATLPHPLFKNLIARNDHISKLEVIRNKIHKTYEFPSEMPNLTDLSLELKSAEDVQKLDTFAKLWSRLTKLHLQYQPVTPKYTPFAEWLRYLENINKNWGNSKHLVDLTLQLPLLKEYPMTYLSRLNLLRLELPGLKRVKLIMDSACSLDILLKCSASLELLDIYGNYTELDRLWKAKGKIGCVGSEPRYYWDDNKRLIGTVEWLGKEEYMYKSNIWKLFPKLKKITVETQTRDLSPYRYNVMEFFREKLEKNKEKGGHCMWEDDDEEEEYDEGDEEEEGQDDNEIEDDSDDENDEEIDDEDDELLEEEEENDQDDSEENEEDSSDSDNDLFGFGDNSYSLRRQQPMFMFPDDL